MGFVNANESFSPKSGSNSKQETEKLFQMLEVKLGQERVAWQKSKSRLRGIRTASFLFLFLIILGAIAAFYFLFIRAQDLRMNHPEKTTLSDH